MTHAQAHSDFQLEVMQTLCVQNTVKTVGSKITERGLFDCFYHLPGPYLCGRHTRFIMCVLASADLISLTEALKLL